jgi:hypothetical protein
LHSSNVLAYPKIHALAHPCKLLAQLTRSGQQQQMQ